MNIVIINKDQPPMSLAAFPSKDRITVSFDAEAPIEIPGVYTTALGAHAPGFYAGANRNHGLAASYTQFGKSGHVLFLDGDRTPDHYSESIITDTLKKYDADALLLTCKTDPRSIAKSPLLDGPVDAGCLVSEFFSCGFVLTDRAIEGVCAENNGALFHPAFNGYWGEEDKYLGIQLENLGFKTCFTNAIRLGGGPLGDTIAREGYGISLQTRINLMRSKDYPMRNNDLYAHLEKDKTGKVIKVYDGLQAPRSL